MKLTFEDAYDIWLKKQIQEETNPRRREILKKGLSYSTVAFLRYVWYHAIGNFDNLYAEYEVRDLNNRYRYLDIAYLPGIEKGCVEIQDFGSHARDIEPGRFKDLCMKQALLGLDDWHIIPIAYLSIREDPELCKQLVLSFVGKFLSMETASNLNWAEAETLRFARRIMRPFDPNELAAHLLLSDRRTRSILHGLVDKQLLNVASGKKRYRTYQLPIHKWNTLDLLSK